MSDVNQVFWQATNPNILRKAPSHPCDLVRKFQGRVLSGRSLSPSFFASEAEAWTDTIEKLVRMRESAWRILACISTPHKTARGETIECPEAVYTRFAGMAKRLLEISEAGLALNPRFARS